MLRDGRRRPGGVGGVGVGGGFSPAPVCRGYRCTEKPNFGKVRQGFCGSGCWRWQTVMELSNSLTEFDRNFQIVFRGAYQALLSLGDEASQK